MLKQTIMDYYPLVTVGIISYNSEKTIIETLESIYNQSYSTIELIIADDCSKDGTVELCEKWLRDHHNRFQRVAVLSSKENNGIPANCNRLVSSVHGDWLKIIAADDILLPTCIDDCVLYARENKDMLWMSGKTKRYANYFREEFLITDPDIYTESRLAILNGTLEDQQKAITRYSFVEAPALFVKTELIRKVGGYNEEYRFIEDWPMNKKFLDAGYKCHFLDKYLVGYRQGSMNIFNNSTQLFNIGFVESVYKFKVDELFVHHNYRYRLKAYLYYKLCLLIDKNNLNNSSRISRLIWSVTNKILNLIY